MSYSPKIKPELVRRLYLLKHKREKQKIPMTKMVGEAVEEYLDRKEKEDEEIKTCQSNG